MSETVGAAQLAITADATGVEAGVSKAKKSLATLGDAAKDAGKKGSEGIDPIGKKSEETSQKLDRATKQAIAAIQRQTAAFDAGGRSGSKFWESVANQRGLNLEAMKPYLAQLDAAATKQAAAAAAARVVAPAITQVGLSAKQTAFALRGVPAQFTDIATSLAAGQNPMQVFLQQGGQLKDMFGGIGPAARALGGYVAGLINPFTLAAAAVGVLGLAYFQGSREADGYARAVILTGNAAGKTVGQLQMMAERIAGVAGTQAAASEALSQFVANGTFAGDSIERFTTIALKMEKVGGQAVAETVKQFAELGKSPVDASTKLNEATNFLTASVATQIRMLEEQGRTAQAAAVAQKAYADALENRLPQIESRLGLLERAWNSVKGAAKGAWDAMLNIGRQDSLDKQLAEAQERVQALEKHYRGDNSKRALFDLGNARQAVAILSEQQRLLKRGAEAKAADALQVKAQLEFDRAGDQFLTKRQKLEREITEARNQGIAAGKTQVEIDKRIAQIRERYADKGAAGAARRLDRADLGLDIERIRSDAEKVVAVYSQSERKLESLRAAGLVSDEEYYDGKRRLLVAQADAQEGASQKEIARLQAEKLAGADKVTNDKKIVDLQAKLAIQRADTSAKLEELSDKQIQSTRKEAAEFLAAKQAAESYYAATVRRQELELSSIGKGNQQRDFDRGVFDIQERTLAEKTRLENELAVLREQQGGTVTDDQRAKYEQRLSLVQEYGARELSAWQSFNQRKLAADQDWTNGAQEALRNYSDQAGNVAKNVEQFFSNSFSSLENALAEFIQTGKFSFSGLIRSILADLARLQAKKLTSALASALASAIGGYYSGGSVPDAAAAGVGGGGRAIGGPVHAGGMYRVNERRPELLNVGGKQFLMMGSQSGHVAPNSGGGAIHIVNNTQGRVDRVTEQTTSDGDRVLVLDQMIEGLMNNPNSRASKAFGRNTTAGRKR